MLNPFNWPSFISASMSSMYGASAPYSDVQFDEEDEEQEEPLSTPEEKELNFVNFLPEIIGEINSHLDSASRYALSRTCRRFQKLSKDSFERFPLADTCAALGLARLLEWSVDLGAPLDAETALVAARHGQVEILEMYLRRKYQIDVSQPFEPTSQPPEAVVETVQNWGYAGALNGCQPTLNWLIHQTHLWEKYFLGYPKVLFRVMSDAARGGHVGLTFNLWQASQLPLTELWNNWIFFSLFAAEDGHLEAVKKFHQLELEAGGEQWCAEHGADPLISHIMKTVPSRPEIVAWCLAQDPELDGHLEIQTEAALNAERLEEWRADLQPYIQEMIRLYHHDRRVFNERMQGARLPVLQFMLKELGIEKFENVTVSNFHPTVNAQALQWMKEHGITLDFNRGVFDLDGYGSEFSIRAEKIKTFDKELLAWLLREGVKPTKQDIIGAALSQRIDILDMLWESDLVIMPLDAIIPHCLAIWLMLAPATRVSFRSRLETIKWLKEKGCGYYTWSLSTTMVANITSAIGDDEIKAMLTSLHARKVDFVYDWFVLMLLRKKPQFVKDYLAEIQALEFPLSDEVAHALSKVGQTQDKKHQSSTLSWLRWPY